VIDETESQQMKVTKRKIWVLRIVAAAAVVVVLAWNRSRSDDVVIQLVNKRTGLPVTHVTVTILDSYLTPILSGDAGAGAAAVVSIDSYRKGSRRDRSGSAGWAPQSP